MQRLCSLHILCCLILQIFSNEVETQVAALCDGNTVFNCDNFNISAPFWGDAECAASNSFVISNCASTQPVWQAFEEAVHYDNGIDRGPPELMGMYKADYYTYINLTWPQLHTTSMDLEACAPLLSADVGLLLPDVIDLTSFANGSFRFSNNTYYLLFGCTNLGNVPADVVVNSSICKAYKEQCATPLSCVQLMPFLELALHATLDSLSCSHFMFLTTNVNLIPVPQWGTATVQLIYGDVKCQACATSGGLCVYTKDTHIFNNCVCSNKLSDTDCYAINGCEGVWCSIRTKIGLGVAITVAITLVLAFTLWGAKRHIFFQKRLELDPKCCNLDLDNLTERPIEMSYSLMVPATNNFIYFLGEGGFGAVYRGSLTDVQIAVKVVQVTSEHRKKHFLNEVSTIGRIHHVHVVRLLGFCVEEHHRILVYEYVNNGSLDKWLFNQGGDPERPLHWRQRYAIAVGIAKGLGYLHEECRHRIVHCDIKPQNILLDEHLCPKIADFGLAKLMARDESAVATLARGTPGYVAPEFWMGGESHLSTKFDVYSYGMVLLELISGHPNFENGSCFPEEAFEAAMKGDIQAIIDIKLGITMAAEDKPMVSTMEQLKHIRRALFVSLWCIQDHPMDRPHMSEVVQYLEGKMVINEHPPRPAIASMLVSLSRQQSSQGSHHHHDITSAISGR